MHKELHLFPIGRQEVAAGVRHVCRFERRDDGVCVEEDELWFEFPEWPAGLVPGDGDPFFLAFFPYAMEEKRDLWLHGGVSRSLIANLQEFHDYWSSVCPNRYPAIGFGADTLIDDSGKSRKSGAVTLFSGGVDASFTAWRHVRKQAGTATQEIRLGIFIDGFERVSVDRHEEFVKVIPQVREQAADLGIPLVIVSSNYRRLKAPEFVARADQLYAPYLAALLHHFKGIAGTGLIPSSYHYNDKVLVHSEFNPVTDPLLSSATLRIVHDGAAYHRIDKHAVLNAWPLFEKTLRVCWYPLPDGGNCGRCEKCLRTMLGGLITAGRIPMGFPQDHDALRAAILEVKVKPKARDLWREMRDYRDPHPESRLWMPLIELKCRKRWKERRHEVRDLVFEMLRPLGFGKAHSRQENHQ